MGPWGHGATVATRPDGARMRNRRATARPDCSGCLRLSTARRLPQEGTSRHRGLTRSHGALNGPKVILGRLGRRRYSGARMRKNCFLLKLLRSLSDAIRL